MKNNEGNPKQGRRDALKTIVSGAGGLATLPILGQAAPSSPMPGSIQSPSPGGLSDASWTPTFFDQHQNETIVAVTDLIIPTTDTPGAKAAMVNRYIDLRYSEESPDEQEELIRGLGWLDGRSISLHQKPFVQLDPAQQTSILESIADPNKTNPQDQPGVEFFQLIKGLTIFGYYTSQIGMDQELKYQGDTYNESFPGACSGPKTQS